MEKEAIQYGLILDYGIQMTIVFAIGIGIWTVKVLASKVETYTWYKANGLRIFICLILFWLISAGIVVVPNFAEILGSWGFNADQSAAGIALVIVGLLIKTEAKLPENKPVDPIPSGD